MKIANWLYEHSMVSIIVVFFIGRLVFTTQPPIEYQHTWRQSTGLMYARNFLETDHNIMHPRIDDNAGGTGIVVLEFPIMYYIHAAISVPLGYQHWYSRVINLLVSSLGIYFFYLLVLKYFNPRIALYAGLIVLTSIWLAFARKTMQDTFAISLMIMALYYIDAFFEKGRRRDLFFYFLLSTVACLAKIPAVIYFLFPMMLIIKYRDINTRVFVMLVSSGISVLMCFAWYFIYAPYISKKYGYWHNLGESFSDGFLHLIQDIPTVLQRFFHDGGQSFVFIVLFLLGWMYLFKTKAKWYFLSIGGFTVLFLLYMVKSGNYFLWHNYYIIPYVPIFAIVVAIALDNIKYKKLAYGLLVVGLLEGIFQQVRDFTNSPNEAYKEKLEVLIPQFSNSDDKICLVSNGNPIGFYFAHRKGWMETKADKLEDEFLQKISDQGVTLLIVNKRFSQEKYDRPLKYEDDDYAIYELKAY